MLPFRLRCLEMSEESKTDGRGNRLAYSPDVRAHLPSRTPAACRCSTQSNTLREDTAPYTCLPKDRSLNQ